MATAAAALIATAAVDPTDLHPALWRAHQLGRSAAVSPSGFAALDDALPGGGWPAGALTELLLPHPGVGEWRLLAPALAALQRGGGPSSDGPRPRSVLLFDPPAQPCAWTLAALGLDLKRLLLVQGGGPAAAAATAPVAAASVARRRPGHPLAGTLWAVEQALASGEVGAVLAWLPARLPADALRRLQLAAQSHPGPVFLLRPLEALMKPSAAPLRLRLAAAGADALQVHVVKRRGPPPAAPLLLPLAPVLAPTQRQRSEATRGLPLPLSPLPHAVA